MKKLESIINFARRYTHKFVHLIFIEHLPNLRNAINFWVSYFFPHQINICVFGIRYSWQNQQEKKIELSLTETVENHKFSDAVNLTTVAHTFRANLEVVKWRQQHHLNKKKRYFGNYINGVEIRSWLTTNRQHKICCLLFFLSRCLTYWLCAKREWENSSSYMRNQRNEFQRKTEKESKLLPEVQIFRWANID